ncbi:hypothetical protein VNO80_10024 [Phaseolus coccineus]|uniref:Uncharacterized protein n=1 Tax=Phaseolus coccineus TaxID=3886 RepID=A0AAN9NCN9_PHACN
MTDKAFGEDGEAHVHIGYKEMHTLAHNFDGGARSTVQVERQSNFGGSEGGSAGTTMAVVTKEEGSKEVKKLDIWRSSKLSISEPMEEFMHEANDVSEEVETTPLRSRDQEIAEVKGASEERTPCLRLMWAYINGNDNVCKSGEGQFGRDVGAESDAGMGGMVGDVSRNNTINQEQRLNNHNIISCPSDSAVRNCIGFSG